MERNTPATPATRGEFSKRRCEDCSGLKKLEPTEAQRLLAEVPGWIFAGKSVEKEFLFANFVKALDFVNRVGKIAEAEGHHPDIFLHDYKKVKISLWTHTVGGLTENDFILAAKINEI